MLTDRRTDTKAFFYFIIQISRSLFYGMRHCLRFVRTSDIVGIFLKSLQLLSTRKSNRVHTFLYTRFLCKIFTRFSAKKIDCKQNKQLFCTGKRRSMYFLYGNGTGTVSLPTNTIKTATSGAAMVCGSPHQFFSKGYDQPCIPSIAVCKRFLLLNRESCLSLN